jgi:2-keto-4-pentenoate hydratase/2-oxohepta-3-ene-1,7-dioic acid hydratase in catechol pathway
MENTRRDFLRLGAGAAALGSLVAASGKAAAQSAAAGAPIANTAAGRLRLVTFTPGGTAPPRVGFVSAAGRVIDIGKVAEARGLKLAFDPTSMVSLIAAGPAALDQVRQFAGVDEGAALDEVRLLAPIPNPQRNVYAVGWNYLEHFEEGKAMRTTDAKLPEHPVFFTKGVHTVNAPFGAIPFDPEVSTMIDWEGELAVIIGKKGRNIPESSAMEHVFGYAVINDTTARDVQQKRHGGQWFKGKSLDGHGPLGPWIIPASELDHGDLHILTRVNGVVKQDASTKQMYFKVPRIVAELSLGLTLEPGDIIATGTPPGVGAARKPPEFLKPGDVLETEIVEIGVLRNVIGVA